MTTPVWAPGTLYAPGALVQPLSAIAPVPDPVTNGDFEAGNTGWTLDSGFSIGQFGNGTHFDGTWSLQWDLTGTGRAINAPSSATEVTPGTVITAKCQVQQGASSAGQAGARVEIAWYDSSDDLISYSSGNLVTSTSNQNWKQSTVTGTAPAGAAFARVAVYAFRNSGGDELWVDAVSWDAVITSLPDGLVFKAVQAVAGYSASTEPVWPIVVGNTVVDNEVTWEAVYASRVEWEASPILVSGSYEPTFPTTPDGTVVDGSVIWTAMNFRVTDAKCPQGPVVAIGASKVFCADDDIIAFSATVNPLDWSSEQDAGYLPFGLQTYGSTPVEAFGLYRGNLVAFNSEGYQMWQIDQDPANMALLDASPIACQYPLSVQPVSNDLVFLTPEGIRNIGIAGASTNLQAGYFGKQIDPLVLAKIRAGTYDPFALFWPGAGQYWLIFGDEAFVLTMNGGTKDMSWSRYVFPEALTDWAILGTDLYLRAGDLVWRVSEDALQDDAPVNDILCDTSLWADGDATSPPTAAVASAPGEWLLGDYLTNAQRLIEYTGGAELPSELNFTWSKEGGTIEGGYPVYLAYGPDAGSLTFVQLSGSSGEVTVPISGGTFVWGVTTASSGSVMSWNFSATGDVVINDGGCATDGTDFTGYMAWPYLDFGALGRDKMMEGFDLVCTGEVSVSFGYSQANTALATTGFTLDGDTLPGATIPMPISGPSFQLRLTFSADQTWEWEAAALYLSPMGNPP